MKKLLFFIITMQITLFAQDPTPINSGDVVEDHVDYLEKKHYIFDLDKGKTAIVKLTDLDADIDLYVALNHVADIRDNDCYSSNGGTTNEKCLLDASETQKSNEIRIMVYGFKASNYKLEVSTKDGLEEITEISDTPIAGQVEKGDAKLYKFAGKKGESYTTTLSALSADADLRVRIGKKANLHSFDCKSTNGRTKTDECSVTLTKDATVYVHVNGYKAASYKIGVVKFDPTQNFPKTRLFTEDKKYFLAYEKINNTNDINIFVVNNQTKQATDHLTVTTGLAKPMDILKIKGVDIFKSGIDNHYLYAINSNGKFIEVTSNYKIFSSYGAIHTDNYTTNKILNVQYNYQQNNEDILEIHSFDVSNPFTSDIVNKIAYKEKEILNFLAKYNCSNLHANNKLGSSQEIDNSYICSEENNKAYILYKKELTLIDINKPNTPIKTFENQHLLGEDKDSIHKINHGAFYTESKKIPSKYTSINTYSIYTNNKLSLTLQRTTVYDQSYIESIEYKSTNKITVHLSDNSIKVYDISDTNNPKLIKDDSPKVKITILDK